MNNTNPTPVLPISRAAREVLNLPASHFDEKGRLILRSPREARELSLLYRRIDPDATPLSSDLYGAACINTAWELILELFADSDDSYESAALETAESVLPADIKEKGLQEIMAAYPMHLVWSGQHTPQELLAQNDSLGREEALRSYTLVSMSLDDPAFSPFHRLFSDFSDAENANIRPLWECVVAEDPARLPREPEDSPPLATLRKPVEAAPNSVRDQLMYILSRWGKYLGNWAKGLIAALDMIEEETRPRFGGPGQAQRPGLLDMDENARFSRDDAWMPRVVLLAKNILVWLNQLSRQYKRPIHTLDAIPDEELSTLAERGFNALWLIGLWERSNASREIKRRMGNPEAAASAYSLFGYNIAEELGGWGALENLRQRAGSHGIRLSSDMVPNHVGLDSDWVRNHPEWLLSVAHCPYPGYSFNSDNLSEDSSVGIRLEDHYWNHSDAAVVFKRIDTHTGDTRFVYHGNDGTTMPWNDTAQIDFLNAEAREAVIQDIIHVARNFSIIRFDAAMVLARKHIRRLWFPAPGEGGAIPSRSDYALSDADFFNAIPKEFWREVVDRVATEAPGTLLLAEAFWMMEGYFVRVLGMHRVYNSAFMNMLRNGKNDEYRAIIKETLSFDPGILQRFVNFMNNPDEETAVAQFDKDDRYFAVCTLLVTLPGLPMFGHGQIEGYTEKYGMEYIRAYWDEVPDAYLVERHEREIFPLLAHRSLFAGAELFRLYDLMENTGVAEDVYAYTNSDGRGPALVIVNNAYERAHGHIHHAVPVNLNEGHMRQDTLAVALELNHASGNDWCLMREQISNLWFIRSVGALRETGLEIVIDGYGRQVYMEFRIEQHSNDGIWERLAAELNGQGISDPWAAIYEIRLRPVHNALNAIIDNPRARSIAASIRRGKQPNWPTATAVFTESLTRLAEQHGQLSGETTVHFDAQKIYDLLKSRLGISALQWRALGRGNRRKIYRLFRNPNWDQATLLAIWSVLATVAAVAPNHSISEIRDIWDLDKWLSDRFPGPDERRIVELVGMLLSADGWNAADTHSGKLLSDLMAKTALRSLCGVNSWNDILWYDRDGWDDCVLSLSLSAIVDSGRGISGYRRRRRLMRVFRKWWEADRNADYQLDRLIANAHSGTN